MFSKRLLWVVEWAWKNPTKKQKAGWRPLEGYARKKDAMYECMCYKTDTLSKSAKFRVARYTPILEHADDV